MSTKRHKRPNRPQVSRVAPSSIDVPNVIWRAQIGAEHRMEVLEEASRLRLAGGENMVRVIRRSSPKTKIVRAKRMPSGLVGADGKALG